jgi:hypothetical protein
MVYTCIDEYLFYSVTNGNKEFQAFKASGVVNERICGKSKQCVDLTNIMKKYGIERLLSHLNTTVSGVTAEEFSTDLSGNHHTPKCLSQIVVPLATSDVKASYANVASCMDHTNPTTNTMTNTSSKVFATRKVVVEYPPLGDITPFVKTEKKTSKYVLPIPMPDGLKSKPKPKPKAVVGLTLIKN